MCSEWDLCQILPTKPRYGYWTATNSLYRTVIIAKLLYASSSWCGFTTASDRQRLEASLRRAQRSGLYHTDKPTLTQLAEDADNTLFRTIITPSITFYTVSYLSELTRPTYTILDLGVIILNLALSMTTVILFTECCLRTTLTFPIHCKCSSFYFLSSTFLMRFYISFY